MDKNPILVADAVDTLNHLGFKDIIGRISDLLVHKSPYVVGSALRFISKHDPARAKPLLLKALESGESIVRQTAIDEIDHLEYKDALPRIRPLLSDPDADVRQAAQTAVKNLGGEENEEKGSG
jgi:HEAT repeat protein